MRTGYKARRTCLSGVIVLTTLMTCAAQEAVETTPAEIAPTPIISDQDLDESIPVGPPVDEQATPEWIRFIDDDDDDRGIRVTPYGLLWANMWFATSRTNPGSFTLWVFADDEGGEPAFELDARRSRIGFEVVGPDVQIHGRRFDSRGAIELDFFGQFLTENRADVRLRDAYWEAVNDEWRFLIGQTWDVISPLRPGMLNFTVGWAGGNIGFRRTQFRVEHANRINMRFSHRLEASLNQNIVDDFQTEPGVRRESVEFPVVMARYAITYSLGKNCEAVLGISGHYGQTGFDFLRSSGRPLELPPTLNAHFNSWSGNIDFELPLLADLDLRGEFFHGANLSPFLGGIGQGVCPCLRQPIHSTGGWLELVKSWTRTTRSHFGTGIEDPANSDLLVGRSMNQFIFGNFIWQVTPELSTGTELNWWRTLYIDQREFPAIPIAPGEAFTWEWMVRYEF